MELQEGELFYDIKIINGDKKDENNKQFTKLKYKIDETKNMIKKNLILPNQNENEKDKTNKKITKDVIIKVVVHKKMFQI